MIDNIIAQISNDNSMISIVIAYISAVIAGVSLVYTIRMYAYKHGIEVLGSYSLCSSICCKDAYINEVVLENCKDRAVVIYSIHLRIGYNIYLLLKDYSKRPLVLQPFEAHVESFEPIECYEANCTKVDLNYLLHNMKICKKIVLATAEGKYIVKERSKVWEPVRDFFRNYTTHIVRPLRFSYAGKCYGSNALYIVRFIYEDQSEEIVPIYPKDYEIVKFEKFQLTKDSIESAKVLKDFFEKQKELGNLKCKEILVDDLLKAKEESLEIIERKEMKLTALNIFQYYGLGLIYTFYQNWKLKHKNSKKVTKES